MDLNTNLALTYKAQGGQGLSLSKIRPKGTKINGQFDSDGIIPFMKIFNQTTESVSQGGSRKGALLMSLSSNHKEIEDFISIKTQEDSITKANLSVEIEEEFMEAVEKYYNTGEIEKIYIKQEYEGNMVEYEIIPIDIYKKIMQYAYDWAEPGIILVKRFRNYNLMEFIVEYEVITGNPCFTGDMKLLTEDGYKTFTELEEKQTNIINSNGVITKGIVWSNGEKEIIEITLDNNKKIKCTPDHLFKLNNGEECEAKNTLNKKLTSYSQEEKIENPKVISIKELKSEKVYDFIEPLTNWGVVEGLIVHNCGEQPLPKDSACNIASQNLAIYVINPFTDKAYFDFESFNNDVTIAIEGLDEVLDEGMKLHALESQRQMAYNYRNIGLGIFGLGDMFFKLCIKYGSKESKKILNDIMSNMFKSAVLASAKLAEIKGSFPKYSDKVYDSTIIKNHFSNDDIKKLKNMGLRNCSLLSIAPAGSIGTMLDVTTGIEPAYKISYQKKTESLHKDQEVYYDMFISSAKEYFNLNKTDELPNYFVTTNDIYWKDRIDIQAIAQNHVDTAISSTVNLPNNITIEEIEQLYLYAWKQGLKGVTIFREGCKRDGVLSDIYSENKSEEPILKRREVIKAPNIANGITYKFVSGCGNVYLNVTHDDEGNINQTFTNKGSSGTCKSNQEAVSRLISLALRGGISIDKVIDQLKSVDVCSSYTNAKAKGKPVSKGASCPHAMAYILEKAKKEINNKYKKENKSEQKIIKHENKVKEINSNNYNLCPECKEPLINEGHCLQCKSCGYSKCE